jgi:RNA polymerase sigma factor (sigma-70 family)
MGGLIGKLDRYRKSGHLANKVEIAGHIVDEIASPIWNFLAGHVPPSDVDDLRQEVLLAVALRLDTCNAMDEPTFWGWVYRIAWNKVADRTSKAKRWQLIDREEVFRLIEASTQVEGMTRHERVDTEELLTALDKLDEETRFCIWQCVVEKHTFVQIATSVGKSVSGVRMTCKRGLVKLQKLLERKS